MSLETYLPGSYYDMPAVPGLSIGEEATLRKLYSQWLAYLPRNEHRAARYDGKNAIVDLGISTPPHLRRLPLVLGWPAKAVDMLNQHLHLERWTLDGTNVGDMAFSAALDANRFGSLLSQAQASALTHSMAFVIVTRGNTDAGEPGVLITARDALTATGTWNTRTRAFDDFLTVATTGEDRRPDVLTLFLPNLIIEARRDAVGRWSTSRQTHVYGVPVEPLVYNPDLRRPLGRSRISRALMSIHDSALRTLLRSEISAEFYSVPKTVLLGADESAFGDKGAWQAVVGRIMALPDDDEAENPRAQVIQLATAPQTPHMEQLRAYGQLFAHEASIPVSSLGIIGEANPTSAEAIEGARTELVTLANATAETWSPSLVRIAKLVEQVATKSAAEPTYLDGLRADWRNPKYTSRAQAADAGGKIVAAAPWLAETEVGLELLGLTDSQIERAMSDKARAQAVLRAKALAAAAGRGITSGP